MLHWATNVIWTPSKSGGWQGSADSTPESRCCSTMHGQSFRSLGERMHANHVAPASVTSATVAQPVATYGICSGMPRTLAGSATELQQRTPDEQADGAMMGLINAVTDVAAASKRGSVQETIDVVETLRARRGSRPVGCLARCAALC